MEKLPFLLTGVFYELIPHERLKLFSVAVPDYKEHQTLAHVDIQWQRTRNSAKFVLAQRATPGFSP